MTNEEWNKLPTINDKWATVVIEGKRVKNKDLIFEIIMRMDLALRPYKCIGNNRYYNLAINDMLNIPDSDDGKENWLKEWKSNPHRYLDNECLLVELVSSSSLTAKSFIHPRTGKIESVHSTGRGYHSCSCNREELEWFAKEFPQVELTVTYYDTLMTKEYGNWESIPICTLQLKDGEITRIATKRKNEKLLKKYYKPRYLLGSSNYSIFDIINIKLKLWKIKAFFKERGDWGNFYHNMRINEENKFENYYSLAELQTMVETWKWRDEDNN